MEKNFNNNQPELSVQEQTRVRIEKLDKLKEKGVAPFGQKFDVKDKICDIKANYENKSKEELEEKYSTLTEEEMAKLEAKRKQSISKKKAKQLKDKNNKK